MARTSLPKALDPRFAAMKGGMMADGPAAETVSSAKAWGSERPAARENPLAKSGRLSELLGPPAAEDAGPELSTKAGAKSLEHQLVDRITMGATPAEIDTAESLGFEDYLETQLAYKSLDDSELEDALAAQFPTLGLNSRRLWQIYANDPFEPALDLMDATIYRAIYSPRQLFERMVIFWSDHFSIDIFDDWPLYLKPIDDRDVIRRHALGKFPELLSASAHSPAMLTYLDNDTNRNLGLNENYGRELMELHTLGADRGYTQKDVVEVARCFTGWTFHSPYANRQRAGEFRYWEDVHDPKKKRVLGQRIKPRGGKKDGEKVLEILVEHPNTAEYIAFKMARYFLGYDPPASVVESVAQRYLATGGDIKAMLRAILTRENLRRSTPKLKRPFHYLISAMRSLRANLISPRQLWSAIAQAGHLPFAWTTPDGYPDDEIYWSGLMLPRWNFVFSALAGDLASIEVDTSAYRPKFTPKRQARLIDQNLSNKTFARSTTKEIERHLRGGERTRQRVDEALALGLVSPEFQSY